MWPCGPSSRQSNYNPQHYKPIYSYVGQRALLNGVFTKQLLPWSLYNLLNGLTTNQIIQTLLGLIQNASSQVRDPHNQLQVAEQKAYWIRWLNAPFYPAGPFTTTTATTTNIFSITVNATAVISDNFSLEFTDEFGPP